MGFLIAYVVGCETKNEIPVRFFKKRRDFGIIRDFYKNVKYKLVNGTHAGRSIVYGKLDLA